MKQHRPGILSVRAVNQYRRRDVLSYLSLRYYLDNAAARTDQWAKQVAIDLVSGRADLPYLLVHHFKETNDQGGVVHREMYVPGANEVLTEAALLADCADHEKVFSNPECVFSYQLNHGDNRSGIFLPYFHGLQARHDAIAAACDANPDGIVRYTDIRRFYPTITKELALSSWRRYAERANLTSPIRDVAEKLLDAHAKLSQGKGLGILTGPMFSHLIGNLVLRELDEYCAQSLPIKYFRYVDDITLVGSRDAVSRSANELRNRLNDIGFTLHDDDSAKTIEVPVSEWLTTRNDFRESHQDISWASLIGDLKKFLLLNPDGRDNLRQVFLGSELRIPVLDYSNTVFEGGFLERVSYLAKRAWYRRKSQAVSIDGLLAQARSLRTRYREEFMALVGEVGTANPFQRKRRIPKLRYRAGRLIYLSTDEVLNDLSHAAKEISELHFHTHVMQAVATGNLDGVLSIGTNAAQATAQPLRAAGKTGYASHAELSHVEGQSLAVLLFNGVTVERPVGARPVQTELMDVAQTGSSISLMKQAEPFLREMACLHGIADLPRHPEVLESVFDRDEVLTLDAIDQLQQSVSP